MDHRLSTILKQMAQQSLAQIDTVTVAPKPLNSSEEFYERRRTLALNDFNNRDLIQIRREARDTMAMNEVEPIPKGRVPYGEREPFQEVKAHLISPYSERRSASSRSWEDNEISDRGTTPLVDSSGPDRVSHQISVVRELTDYSRNHQAYKEQEGQIYIGDTPLVDIIKDKLANDLAEIRTHLTMQIIRINSNLNACGLQMITAMREQLLLNLVACGVEKYCKYILSNIKEFEPSGLVNLFEITIEKPEGFEFEVAVIKSNGSWEYCKDFEDIVRKDRKFFILPISSKDLASLYEMVRNKCLDILYPNLYYSSNY